MNIFEVSLYDKFIGYYFWDEYVHLILLYMMIL